MFFPEFSVDRLAPAPYNPRKINDKAFDELCRSIKTLGMTKPIIVNEDGTIVAGHQRLRALKAIGSTTVPVYIVRKLTKPDEMSFNQLHNGTDLDIGDEHVRVPPCDSVGYYDVPAEGVQCNVNAGGVPIRLRMSPLVVKYGPWGGIVATQSGECLSGAQYAMVCRSLGFPVRTYYVPDSQAALVRGLFQRAYGEFYYGGLERQTFAQAFAQPKRDVRPEDHVAQRFPSYEKRVMPNYQAGEHILDFGSGYCQYPDKLRAEQPCFPIWAMEFFFRDRAQAWLLDTAEVHRMCDELFHHLSTYGRFDIVVCDYVFNSVDSKDAEQAVASCLNAFCKPGGRIYATGRMREWHEQNLHAAAAGYMPIPGQRGIEFLDRDGLSAYWTQNRWFYQMFHTKAEALKLGRTRLDPSAAYTAASQTRWALTVEDKRMELPQEQAEWALRFEFNLPWPNGQTVGRGEDAVRAWRAAIARE